MKIEKFLNCVFDKILNYPDIHLETLKIIIDKFNYYLSPKEKERYNIKLQLLNEYTSKQITIDSFVHKEKVKQLNKDLNKLKGKTK